jgi:signal transduction histidine kinase
MELHDETGQELTSILLALKGLDEIEVPEERRAAIAEIREMLVGAIHDVRRLAVELRPKALDDFGLVPALERLADTFSERTEIPVDFVSEAADRRLPAETETAVYRVVQEALTNVLKHAQATHVGIRLSSENGTVRVVVRDDGSGFRQEDVSDDCLGLSGMKERIALVRGQLSVESDLRAGTAVVVQVPE